MRIAVVGSGIGGLCAAVGLQRAGADVVVFEQAPELRAGGSGLSVFGNGLRALDSLGLGDEFRAITDAKASTFTGGQRQPDGTWISIYPIEELSELRVVDRADLHHLLMSSLAPGTVSMGRRVDQASEDGVVRHSDTNHQSEDDQFDLVVGADGLHSSLRSQFPDDPGTAYAGYSTWRGISQHFVELQREAGETWGVRRRFGVAPLKDGRVYWFAVATMPEPHPSSEGLPIDPSFATWHSPIPELLEATPPDDVSFLPIQELGGRLHSFVRGRTALLGDAAHAMTPNLGQGGGQAMEDAATLVALIAPLSTSSNPNPRQLINALHNYDALRRPRSQKIARQSRLIGKLAQSPGPHGCQLRDAILRATPRATLRRQLKWLQSWQPPAVSINRLL